MRRRWFGLLLLLGSAICGASASAQISGGVPPETSGAVLQRWGLVGKWSVRCDLPASGTNSHFTYVVEPDGRAFHVRDFGRDYQGDRSEITGASIADSGAIFLTINFESLKTVSTIEFAKVAGNPNQLRAMSNRQANGSYTVKDGRLTGTGKETPVQTRCN